MLVELAHRLVRGLDPRWAQLAAGMLRRGKPKNIVIAAVANRWVRWLHHELRRETSAPARQKGAAPSVFAVASAFTPPGSMRR